MLSDEDKEHLRTFISQRDFAWNSFNARRGYEWKLSLAI